MSRNVNIGLVTDASLYRLRDYRGGISSVGCMNETILPKVKMLQQETRPRHEKDTRVSRRLQQF